MAGSTNLGYRVISDTSQFDAGMMRVTRTLKGLERDAKAVFGAMTMATAAFGAAVASAAQTIADFERANSELAAVLGTSLKGVEDMSKSARELGRTSEFTASEVTQLQIALARLGFDRGQIENMQGSVLKFAQAMGTDLGSAAEFTGSALRAFGLQTKDTQYLLDVMSASTTNSALDFSKLQASISTVAPIAKSFGLDVKETAAFLGVLSNNGFDASTAATALRNILLNLADSNGKLSQGIGHSARSFGEIIKSFQELRDKGVDVAQVLEMTDRRSAAAAATIIDQAQAVADLKNKLDNAQGSLDQMSDTMTGNLIGSVKSLDSAIEGLGLAFSGTAGPMKWFVDRLTDMTNRLTDLLGGDKASIWEALLGPITGGAITGARNRRREERRESARAFFDESMRNRGGQYRLTEEERNAEPVTRETTTTPTDNNPKKKADTYKELQKAASEAARAVAEVNSADAEFFAEADAQYNTWRERQSWFQPVTAFDNDLIRMFEGNLHDLNQEMELNSMLDQQISSIIEELQPKIIDLSGTIRDLAESGFMALGDALGGLLGDLATGGDAFGNFRNTALSAFGDMATSIGRIAIGAGVATLAIKSSLTTLQGWGAIAAGTALVALGAAVKAGLSNIASGNYSASGSVASGNYASYGNNYETREVQVNVSGTIEADGDKLAVVLNNSSNKKDYTT